MPKTFPVFTDRSEKLLAALCHKSHAELAKLWKCNEELCRQNEERLHSMALSRLGSAALFSYEGIQYQYMAPLVFTEEELAYAEQQLRILSGFYGILRPFDSVFPYRLEMQAALSVGDAKNLYAFWGDSLYKELQRDNEDRLLINLASKEYSRCIIPYLQPGDRMITCHFASLKDGKPVEKATYEKMARGMMVRYMASRQIFDSEALKAFDGIHYQFSSSLSDEKDYYFILKSEKLSTKKHSVK